MASECDNIFEMRISEGHIFRCFIDLMGKLIAKNVFGIFFNNKGITIRAGIISENASIVFDTNIYPEQLLRYVFNYEDEIFSKSVDIQSMMELVKGTGKQDSVTLSGDKENIIMEMNGGIHDVKISEKTAETFEGIVKDFTTNVPNDEVINVTCKLFCNALKTVVKSSVNGLIRIAYNKKLTLQAITKSGKIVSEMSWPDYEVEENDECLYIDIPAKVAKDLTKLASITSGVLKIRVPANGLLIISHSMGFGDNKILIDMNHKD